MASITVCPAQRNVITPDWGTLMLYSIFSFLRLGYFDDFIVAKKCANLQNIID